MGSIWQSAMPRTGSNRFPPWAWAFLAAAIFTGFIILGFSFSAWASPPGSVQPSADSAQPPIVGDIELNLGDRTPGALNIVAHKLHSPGPTCCCA